MDTIQRGLLRTPGDRRAAWQAAQRPGVISAVVYTHGRGKRAVQVCAVITNHGG